MRISHLLAAVCFFSACGDSEASGGSGGAGGQNQGGESTSTGGQNQGGAGASSGGQNQGGQGGGQGGEGGQGEVIVGGDRPATVQIPEGYDPNEPAPLLVLLHGYGASGAIQESYFQLAPVAASQGMLFVAPDGTVDPTDKRFWSASAACCDFYDANVDDSAYLAGLVAEVQSKLSVDPKRIYFVGHSNGAFMSYRMACDHAGTIAAIVGLAGANPIDMSLCDATSPVSVLSIHGTADATVLYGGGVFGANAYPGAITTISGWAEKNGCATTTTLEAPLDLESTLLGAESTVAAYDDCPAGVATKLATIVGGSHIPSLSDSFADEVVAFLLAHPKP